MLQQWDVQLHLNGGVSMLDAAEEAAQSGNATDALKWLMVGTHRIHMALKELQQGDPRIEQYSVRVAIANSQAGEMKTCKLRGSCTTSNAVVGGSGGKSAAVDAVLSSFLTVQ